MRLLNSSSLKMKIGQLSHRVNFSGHASVVGLKIFFTALVLLLILNLLFPFHPAEIYLYVEDWVIKLLSVLLIIFWIFKVNKPALLLLSGGSIGAWVALSLLGTQFVDPTQIGWLMRDDWHTHFLGWQFFRHEAWQEPLGKITPLFYPIGTSIGYTDSIPLVAFTFKLFDFWLPADFQYLGMWLLLCFVLQGVWGMALMQLITVNRWFQWIGTLFFVTSPILLNRIGHPALSAHWLLLAGIWLYFKPLNKTSRYQPFVNWAGLVGVSALIHPYLTVMVLGLATAFYGRWWLVERQGRLYAVIGQLGLLGLLVLILWWQVGYFLISDRTDMVARELGHYSMNLLAFINPHGWSGLLRDLPLATTGQYEGFGYLGAGFILLSSWAVYELNGRPLTATTVKQILPLSVVVSGMLIFALSPKITAGQWILFDGQSTWLDIFAPFQSSGRFLWPAYYLLIFIVLKLLITRHSPRRALLFLSLGLAIQWLDLQAVHHQHRQRWSDPHWQTWDTPLKSKIWTLAAPHYQHIMLIPPMICGEPATPYLPFTYLAARYGLTINAGYVARLDSKKAGAYCQAFSQQLQQGTVDDVTIYLLHPTYLENFKQLAKKPLSCATVDNVNACVTTHSYQQWQNNLVGK